MQSSSSLFPVALVATEMAGELHEDVYQLNPGISVDPTVRLAVTRVTDPAWAGERAPVVLLHSEFHNKRQWLSPRGEGFAALLARYGFDVWLPEMRGHGMSPPNQQWARGHQSLLAQEDLPPIHRFVSEQTGRSPVWIGRGLGARLIACGIIENNLLLRYVPGVVFIEPGNPRSHWTEKHLSVFERWGLARRDRMNGRERGWGPEDEPALLFRELYRAQRRSGRNRKHPVYDRLRVIRCPSLVVSMGKDEETRHFAGLLGGQIRQTLLSHRYDEDVVREVKGSDVPLAMQNDIRAWLDEACRHMDTSPVEQRL